MQYDFYEMPYILQSQSLAATLLQVSHDDHSAIHITTTEKQF